MANYCNYNMVVIGTDSKTVKRMLDILSYKDAEWCLSRVFSAYEADELKSDGNFYIATFGGDVAWSCDRWMGEPSNPDRRIVDHYEKNEDGTLNFGKPVYGSYKMTSLMNVCHSLGVAVEIYSSEPGIGFQEHIVINHNGKVIANESVNWTPEYEDDNEEHHKEEGGFDDFCTWEDPKTIF